VLAKLARPQIHFKGPETNHGAGVLCFVHFAFSGLSRPRP
jgi:hypothetical protein